PSARKCGMRSAPPRIGRSASVAPCRDGSASRKPTTWWRPSQRMMSSRTRAEPSARAPKITMRSPPPGSGTRRRGPRLDQRLHVADVVAARILVVDPAVDERRLHLVDRRLDGARRLVAERALHLGGVDVIRPRIVEAGERELAGYPLLHHLRDVDHLVVVGTDVERLPVYLLGLGPQQQDVEVDQVLHVDQR